MATTRTLAALVAGLALTGLGTAAALGDDRGPTAAPAAVSLLAADTTSATPLVASTGAGAPRTTAADAARIARSPVGTATAATVARETEHGRTVEHRAGDEGNGHDRSRDGGQGGRHGGGHGGDDGPGHDLGDDRGGDR